MTACVSSLRNADLLMYAGYEKERRNRMKNFWKKMTATVLAGAVSLSGIPGGLPGTAGTGSVTAAAASSAEQIFAGSFVSRSYGAAFETDAQAGTVTMGNNGGDHFAVYDGLEKRASSFVYEADVKLAEGPSAALIFGIGSKKTPSSKWYGANMDTTRSADTFRLFGPGLGDVSDGKGSQNMDLTKKLHLKVDVQADGSFVYTFGNKGGKTRSISGKIPDWQGGYIGVLTWNSKAVFSNITFQNRTDDVSSQIKEVEANSAYRTNLAQMTAMDNAVWEVKGDGLYSNAAGKGNSFLYSQAKGSNFVYATDVNFAKEQGAAALIFRSTNDSGNKNCYAASLDAGSKKCKLWRWQDDSDYQLIDEVDITPASSGKYTLKVVAADSWICFYVNDTLAASTGDYSMQIGQSNKGQGTVLKDGYFGLLNWNGEMTFQNTYFKEFDDTFHPLLEDITVTSSTGGVEEKPQFFQTEPVSIQYVKNDAASVDVTAVAKVPGAKVTVQDAKGIVYDSMKNIPVAVGRNYITVTNTVTAEDGTTAALTYRVNVFRRQKDEVYYNELYRSQYHYSVKDGWGNDPNGMVYYNGTYHLFYQYYDDTHHGGYIEWAHATSKDLITWEEQPMALYPDANGSMFSGCIVADTKNTSGLFADGNGGLVALITADGNGQRVKLAYSTDEGKTWTKLDTVAADWEDDPLGNRDFRDPKVFRWENKWFMVIAGGPLRIYSSDNLLTWKCESAYPDLHTECPDLYPLRADDGNIKWVLSRGGRYYKVGDFTQKDGNWTFVPDPAYAASNEVSADGVMNFGRDSYAAMTYYVQDFGTAANPTLPEELVEINWANTWDDYCNQVGDKTGEKFNGTYNLNLKLGLTRQDEKYVLTQTPVSAYETLRDTQHAVVCKDVEIKAENGLLKDFQGDSYEIVSSFTPGADTKKIGFRLRTGGKEATEVVYDLESEMLSIDRSRSGIILSNKFAEVTSQHVTRNADGTIDLHIFVDRSLIEVFAKGGTAAGANQIFPSVSSLGAEVFAEGGTAKADIAVYPMASIWKEKKQSEHPVAVASASNTDSSINVGDSIELTAYLLPADAQQDIVWVSENPEVASIETNGTGVRVTALQKGDTKITATARQDAALKKEFAIHIFENRFDTNVGPFVTNGGNWLIDGEILSVSNSGMNDYYMTGSKLDRKEYVLSTDLKYEKGVVNLFFAAKGTDPADGNAYAVQFGDNHTVRLFRFAGETVKEADMGKAVNDGAYHHVEILKTADSVAVSVDGTEYLSHTFEKTEDFYQEAYAGIGLWDGELSVKGFSIQDAAAAIEKKAAAENKAAQTRLQTALKKAKKVVDQGKGKYTDQTWKAFKNAYNAAKKAPEDAKTAKYIKLADNLEQAQANLKKTKSL